VALAKPITANMGKILFVDDNKVFRDRYAQALTRAGFIVQSASTAPEAIQWIRREHYEVAFVDIMLSDRPRDRGGFDVISELLKASPDTRVIVISGTADITVAVEAFRSGAFDFLEKALITPDEIVAAASKATPADNPLTGVTLYKEPADSPMREKFDSWAKAWRTETQFSSSVSEIFLNKNYQAIIGQGIAIVPFILEDLKKGPDHWYWALAAITGANPTNGIPPGDISAISSAWLEWGRRRGIIR
jgi:ActR/RegA family two-component response regulator